MVTDNFNRADGGLGANWTTNALYGAPQIVSNQLSNDAGTKGAYYTGVAFANDHYAQAKLVANLVGVSVRVVNTGGESNFYNFDANSGSGAIRIFKYKNNVGATVLTSDTITVNANDVLYLEAVGSALTAKINGSTVLTTSDSEFTTGSPGIFLGNTGADVLDDFEGGDTGGGATTAIPVFMNQYRQRVT